ncbi:replicative helicase loader/inhibitor [Bacillus tuaregi]|uniref:replicative helicase loader/inhibitor n=1 Tax=Bacillus tuaregi TaxID=1816695 RepID=UPI000A002652|nr:replicative helicase loader/inhibitor [Bacillus tuaregi]
MTKREVFQLLKLISVYYEAYEINQEKVDQWFMMLQDYPYSRLEKNLRKHVAFSPYAPKVSDLIRTADNGSRAIPNVEETLAFLYKKQKPASPEVVQQSLTKIREILGIKRGEVQ